MDPGPTSFARTSAPESGCVQNRPETGLVRTHLVEVLGVRAKVAVSGRRDERIAAIAARQHNRVSRQQLHQAGISNKAITRLVARHVLHPLRCGVFAYGTLAPVELGDETAALLAAPAKALLSHGTAARLWGLWNQSDETIDVLVPDGSATRRRGIRLHRCRGLATRDARFRHGLPVTAPARTALDLAGEVAGRELERAFDQALVSGVMRLQDVEELLSRARGTRGAAALRATLTQHTTTTLTRSEAEELFLELIRKAQLPQPLVNARVAGYEVDFLWPEHRLIVEIDGFRFHSTRRAFDHDHGKDLNLRAAGFDVLRFTYRHLEREPLLVVATVTREVAQVATISAPSSWEMATSTE